MESAPICGLFFNYCFISGTRSVFVRRVVSGYYDDYEKLARDVEPFDGKANIYVTLNPCRRELLARAANRLQFDAKVTTGDDDILCDLWFPFDTDPVRPSDISSTDGELRAALAKRDEVAGFLSPWAPVVKGVSGNGGHGLIRLPGYHNTRETRQAKERLTRFLSDRFSDWEVDGNGSFVLDEGGRTVLRRDGVSVDNTVFNLSRIWKLYGTMACKGDNVPDRPYRRSHLDIMDVKPVDLYALLDEIIPRENEESTITPPAPERRASMGNPDKSTGDYPLLDVPAYLNAWGGEWRVKKKGVITWYQFRTCPLHTDRDGDAFKCGICQFASGKMGAKCMHDPAYGWQDFKAVLGDPRPFYQQNNKVSNAATRRSSPVSVSLSDIEKTRYEGRLVTTEVFLLGVGLEGSYFLPLAFKAACSSDAKSKSEC